MLRLLTIPALFAALALAGPAAAKDYLVTIAKPSNLYLIDAAERKVVRECVLDVDTNPGVIVPSPDGKIAYFLGGLWENVYGVDLETCEMVFAAEPSSPEIEIKTFGSITVSQDGTEIYQVQNPVRRFVDRYQVLDPRLVVYDAKAGLDAKPIRSYPVPRRIGILAADRKGRIIMGGHSIYALDAKTGKTEELLKTTFWDRPNYGTPDSFSFWPIGSQTDEFIILYSAPKFQSEKKEELADFVWGYQAVNLTTGEAEMADFGSVEVLMFTGIRNPANKDLLYGVYTQLSKHNLKTKELIKRVDLPHTYYVVNISTNGRELYVGGTQDDIGVYDSETLERIGEIRLPSGGDAGTATLQVVQWAE
jgi:quinohemoprotein amine dehydrogenase beta subunit